MKFKLKSGSANMGRSLVIEADKGDELAYVDAERICRADLESFLPMTYGRGSKSYEFTYHLGGCVSLEKMLSAPLAPAHLRSMLGSLLAMMQVCESAGLSRLRVVFDPAYVFYDPSLDVLRFAYLPVRTFASPGSESELISRICAAPLADPADQQFAVSVWDFVHRTTILTSVALESFLEGWGLQASGAKKRSARRSHSALGADTRADHGWDFVAALQQEEARRRFDEAAERERQAAHAAEKARAAEAAETAETVEAAEAAGARVGEAAHAIEMVQAVEAAEAAGARVSEAAGSRVILVQLSTGRRFPLGEGEFFLGRSADCEVSLPSARSVSRKHALLRVEADECVLRDLASTNGVTVDGERLAPNGEARLGAGSGFLLGDESFKLTSE